MPSKIRDQLAVDGFAIVPRLLDSSEIAQLIASLESLEHRASVLARGGMFAVRNLLEVSVEMRALADSPAVRAIVIEVLGDNVRPVRGILFDKTPAANWKVPWHQDATIAVAEKREVEGFGPWSVKAGVLHVQPPASVLENMLSVRIHLDPCGTENGALKVFPGSHRFGRLPESEIALLLSGRSSAVCEASAGDALLMRPLLLHASSSSVNPAHRRVIHFDYASIKLPDGLRWAADDSVSHFQPGMAD